MLAPTKKLHTRRDAPFRMGREKSVDWKDAFKEVFDEMPISAVSLKGMRHREGWTQKQLSETIGVSQANLSKMENGKRPIGKAMAKRFAAIFDTDYRVFL